MKLLTYIHYKIYNARVIEQAYLSLTVDMLIIWLITLCRKVLGIAVKSFRNWNLLAAIIVAMVAKHKI